MSVDRKADASQLLRSAGLKVTATRLAVMHELERAPHAVAEAVLDACRSQLPTTSPQAIYGALNALVAAGVVRRVTVEGRAARYERRVGDNHHHVVCTGCGTVADIDCVHQTAPCLTPSDAAGFSIITAEVTFRGLCPACQSADHSITDATATDADAMTDPMTTDTMTTDNMTTRQKEIHV